MSDLKQCDRCGAIYQPSSHTKVVVKHKASFMHIEESTYDLCPKCYEELKEFLGGMDENESAN